MNMIKMRELVSSTVWDKLMSYDSSWRPEEQFKTWLHSAMSWVDTPERHSFWSEVHESDVPHELLNSRFNPPLSGRCDWAEFEQLLSHRAIEELRARNRDDISRDYRACDWLDHAFTWSNQPEGYDFWFMTKLNLERGDYQIAADWINNHMVYSVHPNNDKSWAEFEQMLNANAVRTIHRYANDFTIDQYIDVNRSASRWLGNAFRWSDTPEGEDFWRYVNHLIVHFNWDDAAKNINDKIKDKPKSKTVMEKVYELTGDYARGVVQNYHSKPSPLKHSSGAGSLDVRCFGRKKKRLTLEEWDGVFESRYTIGMEVEKTSLHRDSIHEHVLFTGIERDGSCGYEAVTHILPLLPESKWRNKVFAMMWDAERLIDDRYSQGDNSCGGHITVGVVGMSGDELRQKLRPYAGILYALFRHRLKNRYCNANIRMAGRHDDYDMVMNANDHNGWSDRDTRYQLALVKSNVLEFRLPSRFKSVKQMQNRYELMFEMIDYAVNSKRQSHEEFLRKIRPILMDMYHSKEQVNKLFQMAREMRVFIMDGKIHPNINKFVNPTGHWDSMVIKVETPKRKKNATRKAIVSAIS